MKNSKYLNLVPEILFYTRDYQLLRYERLQEVVFVQSSLECFLILAADWSQITVLFRGTNNNRGPMCTPSKSHCETMTFIF